MPECRRCRRVLPTAEVRRTSLGWLCKDNMRGTRCWQIARDLADRAREAARDTRRRERSAA